MADKIKLVQNDTGPQLQLTLTDELTGLPIDLTGATVTMKFREAGSETTLFTRTAWINSETAVNGLCVIYWSTGNLDVEPGSYEGELEVVFQDAMRQTVYDLLKFTLRADFN
jgi:hypothetical protein